MLTEEVHLIHFDKFSKDLLNFLPWWFLRANFYKFEVESFHLSLCVSLFYFSLASEVYLVTDYNCRHVFVELIVLNLLNLFQKILEWFIVVDRIDENVSVFIASPYGLHWAKILLTCSVMYEDLELSVIYAQQWALLPFESHVMSFSELIFDESSDDVGFSNFFRTEYNIRISFVNVWGLLEFVQIDWLVQWHQKL